MQATNELKGRIVRLEMQYKTFVNYCIEMIQFHRSIIQSELKNEPNTPRDLLNSIILHSENLEKSVKLASNSVKLSNDRQEDTGLKSFKEKIQRIFSSKDSEIKRQRKVDRVFERLESYVSISYIKKNFETKVNRRAGSLVERTGSEIEKLGLGHEHGGDCERIIWDLRDKVKGQEKLLEEKEEKVQVVIRQLEKIRSLQAASLKSFKSQYNSHRNSLEVSPEPYRISALSPNIVSYSKFKSKSEVTESQWNKIQIIKDNIKNIANQASKLNKNSFFELNLEKLQFFIKETEKNLKDIASPCFNSKEKPEKNDKNGELNKKIQGLMANIETQSTEIKNLHGIILGFKRNVNILEKERNELKNEVNSNKTTLNAFTVNSLPEKKLEIIKGNSLTIQHTCKNEKLIKALRKQLKKVEKEYIDIKNEFKLKKITNEASSQTKGLNIEKTPKLKPELRLCYQEQLTVINEKENQCEGKNQILEKKIAELEGSVNFYCKKNKLSEIEKENLTKLLKSYEKCLSTKDEKILCLNQESQQLKVLIDRVKSDKEILVNENLLVKKSMKTMGKSLNEKIIEFEKNIFNGLEIINEAFEVKANNLAGLLTKIDTVFKNQQFYQSQLKTSLEFLQSRLSDKENYIASLQNSLNLTEITFSSLSSKQSETETEKNLITSKFEQILTQLNSKNEELSKLKLKIVNSSQSKLDEADQRISNLMGIIENFETQEKNLTLKLDSQQHYIQVLMNENESFKSESETYKAKLMLVKKMGKKKFFKDENEKLLERNEELLRKLRILEEAEGKDLIYLKNLFQSQVSILDQECKGLKLQIEEYSNALNQERQKSAALKLEYEQKVHSLNTKLN